MSGGRRPDGVFVVYTVLGFAAFFMLLVAAIVQWSADVECSPAPVPTFEEQQLPTLGGDS